MSEEISGAFPPDIERTLIDKVFFYGAGCSSPERINTVREALLDVFPSCTVAVETDMFGAAKALFAHERGIAAILGTGSNSCLWNGASITRSAPSLGYVLGDEGSGAHLGLSLLKLYLNNELAPGLRHMFEEKFEVSRTIILDNVYRKPFPNRYLASFSPFLLEHQHNPAIHFAISSCFIDFFTKNIKIYPLYRELPLRFVGSIAFYFKDILHECALSNEIVIDQIVQHPADNLVNHIMNHEDIGE
jgi:hypothetical protein